MSRTLEGRVRHMDGVRQRTLETLEALAVLVGFSKRIKAAFRVFDLRFRRMIDGAVIRGVDEVFADDDQRTARRQIVNRAAILGRVDDRRRIRRQASEVLRHACLRVDRIGVLEERFHRDRRRDFTCVDQRCERFKNPAMQRIEEMARRQKPGNAVERLVVNQDRTEQRLLGFEIVRRLTERQRFGGRGGCFELFDREDCGICHARTLDDSNCKPTPEVGLPPFHPRYQHAAIRSAEIPWRWRIGCGAADRLNSASAIYISTSAKPPHRQNRTLISRPLVH